MQKTEPKIEFEYLQKVADYLFSLKESTCVAINTVTENPEKFIAACKLASETYYISIGFTDDYKKVKRGRVW